MQTVDQALAGVVLPSGAGTLTIGPQAMEGNLQIRPGDTIKAGYDFTMPGAHAAAQVTIDNASITMAVTCSDGTTPPAITFPLPIQTYSDPAGSPSWYPSGDQSSIAVYQGTVTAPDLCSGGIMSDANGATFKATIFSTDTADKVNFRFHYSDNTAGSWSATITASPTPTAKTVLSATLTPALGLTLAVDHSSAIPGDTLTYSGTVTNTGATLTLTGDFTASASGSSTATVNSYWDDIATSLDSTNWTPLAGAAAQSGSTPAVAPPISSGMTLTSTPVAAAGITYPTSGDPLLGTTMASGSSALWHYMATVPLTPSQVTTLLDPTKVKAVRNSFHLEVSPANPNITQPSVSNVDFSGIFFGSTPVPSGAVTNITIALQPPSGSAIQITSAQVNGLASLAPSASANYSATYQVPAVASKGTTETDDAYTSRLKAIEGSTLTASASASGASTSGNVTTSAPAVSTTEHLPIMTITKMGPPTIPAGTTGTFPLTLQNTGRATASGMAITDSVPSGATGTVSGIPPTLAPGDVSSGTQATFLVPVNQSAGSLTDTASLTWKDANRNAYGPVSGMFTTQVQAANKLSITGGAGPNPTGATEAIKATLVDLNGQPVADQSVFLNVTGANTQQSTVQTDASGVATFSYLGANAGTDTLQASSSNGVQSNTLTIIWFTPIQKVSSTAVQGNFYAEPSNPQSFVATPQSVPDFGQSFPTIDFNPPAGTIPHTPAGAPTDQTRPFTDVTTDVNGNYNGTIVAQGTNVQAGLGNLLNFDAVFTANLIVAQPGDVTFNFYADDGFLFGVGNGATRVSGAYENPPASNASAIQAYPLMGAFNQPGAGTRPVTVHFPTAGTYPYELDYFEANAGALSLTMSVATFTAQTNPLSIYVGYADGLRSAGSIFPFPWLGSPNVTFIGCCPAFDAGAIRFDNSSSNPITLDSVTVDIGSNHFDLWGRNLTVPANQILILSQTSQFNFDTSDFSNAGCGGNNGVIPKVNVTQAGVTTSFNDTNQILNTFGFDLACQGNESQSWQRIGGGGSTINVPLPPATVLALTPATVAGDTVGQTQTFTVSAMDATGQPVINLPVTLAIAGANGSGVLGGTAQVKGTTDSAGLARLSYVGINPGTDTVQVTAFEMGLQALSNAVSVPWTLSTTPGGGTAPAPAITSPSPPDGSTVTKPVPISATFAPPAGQSITSWSVTYQDLSGGSPVTLASGAGTPPATLATFDPTQLLNGGYAITISATASGGATQVLTAGVIVSGNLKLGRYVTTSQDLAVPVNGFQMQVRRVYDSTDKHVGDFGAGWHVELANFRITTNRQLGAGGWTQYNSFCSLGLCLTGFKTATPHFVTVIFPDGHSEVFDFTPTGGTNVFLGGGAAFTARQGTFSTLQADGDPSLSYNFDGNLYGANGLPYDPQRFKLTTRDGRVLFLDRTTGLVSETDRNGNSLTVDATGVHASSGASLNFTRDPANGNRITTISGPIGEKLLYGYSGSDLTSYTDAVGNLTTYTYDGNHDLLSATGPSGPFQTLQYDANNRLVAVTDANGKTTTLSNNVSAQQQVVADPNGQLSTIYVYDDLGDLLTRQQVYAGITATTSWTYDSLGRPTSTTDPLNRTQHIVYDAAGNMVETDDEAGHPMKFTYNAQGQPLTQVDPFGTVIAQLTYDAQGRVTLEQHGSSSRTYTYDAAGHLMSATNVAGGAVESFGYDSAGHISGYTDGSGAAVGIVSDAEGRITSVSTANGAAAKFSYDAAGNVLSATDPGGHPQSFTYDAFGNVKVATDLNGRTTTLSYDPAGRLLSKQNRDGSSITYQRDVAGRVTRKTLSDGTVTTYAYDALGRIVSAANPDAVLTYAYDVANQVTSVSTAGTATSPQPAVTLTYGYDLTGNISSMSGPDGTTKYVYDANHQLTNLTDPAGGLFVMTYDSFGHVTSLGRPNGIVDSFSYDALGELTGRDSKLGSSVVGKADYTYGPTGTRSSLTDLSGTTSYSHDVVGQLTGATHPAGSGVPNEAYTYDLAGNRTSSAGANGSATYDSGDHLTQDALYTYAYDLNGNLLSKTNRSTGAVTSFAWSAENQLRAIHFADGSVTQYRYDPAGRRIEVNASGSISRFVYDRTNAHLQYDGSNQQVLAHVTSQYADDILETTQSGTRMFYLRDALGSTTALTNSTGALIGANAFDSYGNPTNPGLAPWSSYAGREYDSKSGLYFNRLRTYDPGTGRFLSEDPVGAANPYPYAGSDPVDYRDPSGGTFIETALQNAFSGAIVGALSNLLVQIFFSALLCQGHIVIHWGDVALAAGWGAIAGVAFSPWALAASVWTRAFAGGVIGGAVGAGNYLNQSYAKWGDFNHINGTDLERSIAGGFAFGVIGGVYSGPGTIAVSGSGVVQQISDGAVQAAVSGVPGSAGTVGLPYNCNANNAFS